MKIPATVKDFQDALENEQVPQEWPRALKALWYDAKDDWNASHDIGQDMQNDLGSWIHAYLHRKEGDDFNARYWYGTAGKPFPTVDLNEEQIQLIEYVLAGLK